MTDPEDDLDAMVEQARRAALLSGQDPEQAVLDAYASYAQGPAPVAATATAEEAGAAHRDPGAADAKDSEENPTRILYEIREVLLKWYAAAASAGFGAGNGGQPIAAPPPRAEPQEKPQQPGTTWGEAFEPITGPLKRTKLGQIGTRLAGRLKKPVQDLKNFARGGKSRGLPRGSSALADPAGGVPKPPVPTPAAGAAAGGEAAGAAAAGGEAAGAGAAGGAGGLAAAGPYAAVAAAGIAAGAALYEVGKAGYELAYQQEANARQLAQYSAQISASLAQLDAARAFRDMDKGDATAGSTAQLTGGIDRFEKAIQPLEIAVENVKNIVGGAVMDALTGMVDGITTGVEAFVVFVKESTKGTIDLTKLLERDASQSEAFGDWAARTAKEHEEKRREARRRLDRL